MAKVILPESLARLFPGCERRTEAAGGTVSEVISNLNARWPGMRDRVCDSTPQIRRHIMVFVDGERASLETELGPSSEVHIIPAVSGG